MLKLIKFSFLSILLLTLQESILAQQVKTRIISLTPANTEILFALGLDNETVGVSSYCNWPDEAKYKEKVGSFSNPNIEKIISLKPDLVILTGMEQAYLMSILRSLKIDYIVVDPSNLKELSESIEEIGIVTGRQKQAKELIRGIDEVVGNINRVVSKKTVKERPKVYVEIWHDPIMSIGKDSFLNDMVTKAGGINVTANLPRAFSKIDPEVVIYKNPNIVILTYMKSPLWIKENPANRIGWAEIEAVKNKKVFSDINPDILVRPGPRVKEGLMELYKRFYAD